MIVPGYLGPGALALLLARVVVERGQLFQTLPVDRPSLFLLLG